jgi:hypothetical protein
MVQRHLTAIARELPRKVTFIATSTFQNNPGARYRSAADVREGAGLCRFRMVAVQSTLPSPANAIESSGGMVERGGRTVAKPMPNLKANPVRPFVYKKHQDRFSRLYGRVADPLKSAGYDHKPVNHRKKEWRKFNYRRDEYHHTNSVEGFAQM